MKALLIVYGMVFGATSGGPALTSEPMPTMAVCEVVKGKVTAQLSEDLGEGLVQSREVTAFCVAVDN
jgi:hypothetical protein